MQDGEPPKTRLRDAQSARTISTRLIQSNLERNRKWAVLRGMLDGNPPYSSAKLRATGQAYRSNFPSLEGKSLLGSAKTPFYELFSGGKTQIWVSLEGERADQDSRVVTEEVERRLGEWNGFHQQMWKMIDDFVAFGRGHFVWENDREWKFQHVKFSRVLFPDGADVDSSKWDYFLVRQEVPVHWLWGKIKNKKSAESVGWHTQEVVRSIERAAPTYPWGQTIDYMAVQQAMADNDINVSAQSEVVAIANLFIREYDGSWTWVIIDERTDGGTRGVQSDGGFLFRHQDAFKEISHYLSSFFFDVSTGSLNGLNGLAYDIYQFVMVKDRMLNVMADNTFFRGALILQAQDAAAMQNASLTLIGNTVIVPPGVSIQNSQVVGDVETSLAVVRDFDARIQNNTGVYKAQIVKPQGNPRTATEAELQFAQSATLTSSAVNRFYVQLDSTYAETYRRMSLYDTTFIERCTKRGVKKGVLQKPRSVSATRTIGGGSPVQRQQALMMLASIAPQFPESGKREYLKDLVASVATQSKVESYLLKDDEVNLPSQDHWEATVENAAIKEGSPVIWTPEQNDSIHCQVHLGAAMQIVQAAGQGQIGEPEEALAFLQGVVAHTTSTHIPRLEQSRPDEAKMYLKIVKQVMMGAKQLEQALQQRAQQQQAAQQMDADQQLAVMQAQHKAQLADTKTQADIQRKNFKTKSDIQRSDIQVSATIQQQNAKTFADIQNDRMKALSKNGDSE